MTVKNLTSLALILLLSLVSCGRKGPLEKPKDYKKPDFSKLIDEEPFGDTPLSQNPTKPEIKEELSQ